MEPTDSKKTVPVAELRVDLENPRLPTQTNHDDAVKAMVANQKQKIVILAEDVSQNGLNKAESFMALKKLDGVYLPYYTVLDGNRRTVVLKILENPSLADGLLTAPLRKRLQAASDEYKLKPIEKVEVAIYDSREEAAIWMARRHANNLLGAGLEKWSPDEIKRFAARIKKGGKPSVLKAEIQIIDFVRLKGGLTSAQLEQIDKSTRSSTLERIITDPYVKGKIGYLLDKNNIRTELADSEIVKPFRRMVLELTDPDSKKRLKVGRVMDKANRKTYIDGFGAADMPDLTVALVQEHNLGEANKPIAKADGSTAGGKKGTGGQVAGGNNTTNGGGNTNPGAGGNGTSTNGSSTPGSNPAGGGQQNGNAGQGNGQNGAQPNSSGTQTNSSGTQNGTQQGVTNSQPATARVTIIPKDCRLKITESRIHNICQELQYELEYEKCLNACALLLPIFIELSLDHYISRHHLPTATSTTVVEKLQGVMEHMLTHNLITSAITESVPEGSESGTLLIPTAAQMHNYGGKTSGDASRRRGQLAQDLCIQWDVLQPLMKIIWPA